MRVADIFGRPFAFYPWIFLTSKIMNTNDQMYISAKKCHEDVHLKRQKSFLGALKYTWKYITDRSFVRQEEMLAWCEELKVAKALKLDYNRDKFITNLVLEYKGCISCGDGEKIWKAVFGD